MPDSTRCKVQHLAGPFGLLLPPANGLAGAFAHPGIGARPLPAYRKPFTMPQSSITTDVHETLNVLTDFAPQVTLNAVVGRYYSADLAHFAFCQIAHPDILVYPGSR